VLQLLGDLELTVLPVVRVDGTLPLEFLEAAEAFLYFYVRVGWVLTLVEVFLEEVSSNSVVVLSLRGDHSDRLGGSLPPEAELEGLEHFFKFIWNVHHFLGEQRVGHPREAVDQDPEKEIEARVEELLEEAGRLVLIEQIVEGGLRVLHRQLVESIVSDP